MTWDGNTIDVGHVHVLTVTGGPCVANCPHPEHAKSGGSDIRTAASQDCQS